MLPLVGVLVVCRACVFVGCPAQKQHNSIQLVAFSAAGNQMRAHSIKRDKENTVWHQVLKC